MNKHAALLKKMRELYSDSSKHSVYQNIPVFVRDALDYTETIDEHWRGDSARWHYMQEFLNFDRESVLDVGANTGFFTLSLARKYPASTCTALEGNKNHAAFIRLVKEHFAMENVRILPRYLDLEGLDGLDRYDTILLFNVLHHAGVDFDQALVATKNDLFGYLVHYMTRLREHCSRLIFQMGYNWGGNKQEPVVDLQDDTGKYVYTSRFMREAGWSIQKIATTYSCDRDIPVFHSDLPEDVIMAANAGDESLLRQRLDDLLAGDIDTFSEFYRRPVFICTR